MWSVELSALRSRVARRGHDRIVHRFRLALVQANPGALASLSHTDIAVVVDAGDEALATREPARGTAAIMVLLREFVPDRGRSIEECSVNGQTGLVLRRLDVVVGVISFSIRAGRVRRVWMVTNPEKLRRWNLP